MEPNRMGGLGHGSPEGAPSFSGYPISDALAGVFGAFSICAALTCRNATPGRPGQEIDLSATEAMLRSLDFLAIEYDQLGVVRERTGHDTKSLLWRVPPLTAKPVRSVEARPVA